jgi:hypothetical protein
MVDALRVSDVPLTLDYQIAESDELNTSCDVD